MPPSITVDKDLLPSIDKIRRAVAVRPSCGRRFFLLCSRNRAISELNDRPVQTFVSARATQSRNPWHYPSCAAAFPRRPRFALNRSDFAEPLPRLLLRPHNRHLVPRTCSTFREYCHLQGQRREQQDLFVLYFCGCTVESCMRRRWSAIPAEERLNVRKFLVNVRK